MQPMLERQHQIYGRYPHSRAQTGLEVLSISIFGLPRVVPGLPPDMLMARFLRIRSFGFVAKAILGAAGLNLLIIPVEVLSISIFGLPRVVPGLPPDMLMARFLRFYGVWDTLVIFFVVGVLWPAAEELFFRGLVQNTLTRNFAVWPSIVGTNIAFALAHFNPAYYLGSLVAGLGLSWIFQRTRSLVLVASIHGLLNLTALLSIYLLSG